MTKQVTLTELQNRTAGIVKSIGNTPIEITGYGRPLAIMLSVKEHYRLLEVQQRYWKLKRELENKKAPKSTDSAR